MAPPSPRALYLDTGDDPVFSFFHPAAGSDPATGVLICSPFGMEDMCSYRSRRQWAQHLAGIGYPALRQDLPGTGDSGGSPDDPGRVSAWTSAVAGGAHWLRAETGCRRVVAIGIGIGGLLAHRAAAEGAAIDDLVLWGVPARGRTLVRELRAFSRLEASRLAESGTFAPAPLPEGALAAAGYLMSAETVAELEALDLSRRPLPAAETRRVLLLDRDGMDVDARLHDALAQSGVNLNVAPGNGWGGMMAEPHSARPPETVFAVVSEWLAGAGGQASAPLPEGPPPAASDTAELNVGDAEIAETPLVLDVAAGQLFGVLTEPRDERHDVCLVLLNAGLQRRIGPNRMWVEMARRWAARGVPALRVDLAGIGDSDGALIVSPDESLYIPAFTDQTLAVIDALAARALPRRFALGGLCSGAYWAFHAALRDERVVAALMLNPRLILYDDWVLTTRESRRVRQVINPPTWRRLLRGDTPLSTVGASVRALGARTVRGPTRWWQRRIEQRHAERRGGDELELALDRLRDSGRHVLLAFTNEEPLYEELEREGRFAGLERWPNVDLEVIAGPRDVHTLQPVSVQAKVHEVVDRALEREVRAAP